MYLVWIVLIKFFFNAVILSQILVVFVPDPRFQKSSLSVVELWIMSSLQLDKPQFQSSFPNTSVPSGNSLRAKRLLLWLDWQKQKTSQMS